MTLFLDRVDAAPVTDSTFPFEVKQWMSTLIDVLNEDIADIEGAVNSTNPITGTTQAAEINSNYIASNVAQTTITLPDKSILGARVTVAGFGAGGWVLAPGAGQTIKVADVGGSASVSITSSSQYDSISIMCVEADTTWITISSQTTGFVIV